MRATGSPRLLELHWPALLVLATCAGLAAGNWLDPPRGLVASCAATSVVVAFVVEEKRRLVALALALVALGLWWAGLRLDALERSPLSSRLGESDEAVVEITSSPRRARYEIRARGVVRRFGAETLREPVLLELPLGRAPPRGAIVLVRARPVEPRGPETGFDERGWLARSGIHVVLHARDPRVVGRRGGIGGVSDRLRAHLERTIASGTAGERRAVLAGIVLGSEDGLTDEVRDAFRASGLTHLLAVSGQNVAITAFGVVMAAWLLGIGRIAGECLAVASVLAYALAVGWEPSVVRATVAGLLASLGWIAARPRDRWHALSLGALVLLAWSPKAVLEPGFQLSFAAVAAMFVALPRALRASEGYPVRPKLAELALVAVVCSVATAPIVWLQFGVLPVWAVPANVLAEPAMPPLIGLSLAAAVVQPVAPPVAAALVWLASLCGAWITLVARAVAALPGAQVRSGHVLAASLLIALGAAALLRVAPWRRRRLAPMLLAVAVAAVALVGWLVTRPRPSWVAPTGLRVTFLDVGQGDSILLEAPGGAVLVDEGLPEARVADQLHEMGLRSLSAIVLTHPEHDHIGGAPDVLRRLSVGAVLDPGQEVVSPDRAAALTAARARRVPVRVARTGDVFDVGRLRLRVLWPDATGLPDGNPNDHAVVLLASFGQTDVLLTADAESNVTAGLPLRPVEILKVAHHGSEDSGLADELRVLRPRLAVISVGADNDYGHPRPETLAALATVPGLRVLRTDRAGRVVVESDGRRITVRTER